jgi:hypothetical protein
METVWNMLKMAAPTHPHPAAPDTPPGNILLGPFVAFMDRVKDLASAAKQKLSQ